MNLRVASGVPEQLKTYDLRKLGNFKKIPQMLGFHDEYPAVHPKTKFSRVLVKNSKKSTVKHSIEKPIFLNLVNLSRTFCPRLSEERNFHFYLGPGPLILHFLKILVFEKAHSLFKLIFKVTPLQKVPEYNIIQKSPFCTLGSSMNLGLNALPVAGGQYLLCNFTFIY